MRTNDCGMEQLRVNETVNNAFCHQHSVFVLYFRDKSAILVHARVKH